MAPTYLRELIEPYHPSRTLRSADQLLLTIPKTRLISYGYCSFYKADPNLWNAPPLTIRACDYLDTFKSACEAYLFNADDAEDMTACIKHT